MDGSAELKPHEEREWMMYSMLKKHGIKPWDNAYTNPEGIKYPEDIRAIAEFDKIVEHKLDSEKRRERAIQSFKAGGGYR